MLISWEVSLPSSRRGVLCVWMDLTRLGGPGRGILQRQLPTGMRGGAGGRVMGFGACLAVDTVKRVLGCDLRCVSCLWVR